MERKAKAEKEVNNASKQPLPFLGLEFGIALWLVRSYVRCVASSGAARYAQVFVIFAETASSHRAEHEQQQLCI